VPPAYYADLACERARCYLSRYFVSKDDGKGKSRDKDEEKKVMEDARKEWRGVARQFEGDSMFYI
jgi:eukaryotic translation initiation factor 2C